MAAVKICAAAFAALAACVSLSAQAPQPSRNQHGRLFPPQDLGLAYDIRHAQVEGGLSWPTHFSLVQSHVAAICVKDFVWDNAKVKNVPLGQGRVNARILQMVKASKFNGPISLHVEYGESSRDRKFFADAFRQDLATLRRWLDA